MKIGIVGARGLVGKTLLSILKKENFSPEKIYLFSSKNSQMLSLSSSVPKMDFVFFCIEPEISLEIYPVFRKKGAIIIDNSSAFRLKKDVPLVVPEVNPEALKKHNGIIANPNCSTIQLVIPLKAIASKYQIKEIFVSTYQSVSGAGKHGLEAYRLEIKGRKNNSSPFHERIFNNLFPVIGKITDGFSTEEWKMKLESEKILKRKLNLYATCVRVPLENCHSQSVTVRTEERINIEDIKKIFSSFPSLSTEKDIPTPLYCKNKDKIFIGRIRQENPYVFSFFSVFDNLRKGAATNAYQIMKILWSKK